MSDLRSRVLTSLAAVAIVIPALILSPLGLWFFCLIVSMASLYELLKILQVSTPSYRWAGLAWGGIFWLTALLEVWLAPETGFPDLYYWLEVVLVLPVFLLLALYNPYEQNPGYQIGSIIFAFAYVVLPLYLLFDVSLLPTPAAYSFHLPLGFLFLTWALDVAAYFGGKFLGRRPLFARISPKKTWEGAIIGAAFCLCWGWVNNQLLPIAQGDWILVAGIVAVFSQLGDLIESMFKRSAKIKDSGGLLPGHGGMLDRFDGTFLSLPLVYLYLYLF
jgi:phosphatidate cytidylyltransferase